jgi:hypothetical protein
MGLTISRHLAAVATPDLAVGQSFMTCYRVRIASAWGWVHEMTAARAHSPFKPRILPMVPQCPHEALGYGCAVMVEIRVKRSAVVEVAVVRRDVVGSTSGIFADMTESKGRARSNENLPCARKATAPVW